MCLAQSITPFSASQFAITSTLATRKTNPSIPKTIAFRVSVILYLVLKKKFYYRLAEGSKSRKMKLKNNLSPV